MNEHSVALAREWRRLGRVATVVAVITSPALFVALYDRAEWSLAWALVGTLLGVAAFRGLIDVLAHKLIPAPSLYGAERELRSEDVVSRRRLWYWRRKYRRLMWLLADRHGRDADRDGLQRDLRRRLVGHGRPAHARRRGGVVRADHARVPADHLDPLLRQLPDPVRPDAGARAGPDQGLRAWRRGLGREDGRRPRPSGGEAGDHPRRLALAVGRGVREGGRQARARRALPRRSRHRQDDALQGHRHLVQLPVRDDPRLGLRADLHRHGRGAGALPRLQGQAPGGQVGRSVHRLHRRDRRRRPAPPGARLGLLADPGRDPEHPRPPVLRPRRRADGRRRPGAGDRRVARAHVPDARRAARPDLPRLLRQAART